MFVDAENSDFHLLPGSPAIGSGRWGADRGGLPYQPTDVDESGSSLPRDFAALKAYPNPFNSRAIIKYALPTASEAKLEIFNILGQKEAVLVNEQQSAGEHSMSWDASESNSGMYFARLSCGGQTATSKLILIK